MTGSDVIRLRAEGLLWRDDGGEIVVLDSDASSYFLINPSATVLWHRLVDGASEADLADELRRRYGLAPDAAATDVRTFVEQLRVRGFLQP